MLFNSTEFIPFLLIVLLGHWVLLPARRATARKAFLVFASYAFYMSWNPKFGALLLFSTLVDYNVARALGRVDEVAKRRLLLGVSLITNLGLLAAFKYGLFFATGLLPLLPPETARSLASLLDVALPIGISFYTFQTLSYTIDVYRREVEPTDKVIDFALYVSFFPQLVAGPIVRSSVFLPQLATPRSVAASDVDSALTRIFSGLIKKVVIADTLATLVEPVFDSPQLVSAPIRLLAVYAYAYQIYFDFSGYSDIAIGLARLFGIKLPENFDRPYLAASPREFWRRWHISLSTWLRDYLYIPLGGTRAREATVARNLLITMLLGGLWHGAAWTFVAWGAYHGVLLVGQRLFFGDAEPGASSVPIWLRRIVTFHLVCFGWLLFRADSLDTVMAFLGLANQGVFHWSREVIVGGAFVVLSVGLHLFGASDVWRNRWASRAPWVQGLGYGVVLVVLFYFSTGGERFIYFEF